MRTSYLRFFYDKRKISVTDKVPYDQLIQG